MQQLIYKAMAEGLINEKMAAELSNRKVKDVMGKEIFDYQVLLLLDELYLTKGLSNTYNMMQKYQANQTPIESILKAVNDGAIAIPDPIYMGQLQRS